MFEAWAAPERIGRWWGPSGFTSTTDQMDFRVGGPWRYTMHGPDGTDYPNRVLYTGIARPERICYEHGDDISNADPHVDVVVTVEEKGEQTLLTLRLMVASAGQLEQMKKFGAVEGGVQTLDRLDAYLAG